MDAETELNETEGIDLKSGIIFKEEDLKRIRLID